MLNRAVLLLKLKQPAIDWVNEADPTGNPGISLDNANKDRKVFLVDESVADDLVNVTHWLKLNWERLFEEELESWYIDESLWVEKRSFDMFRQWFEVETHSIVVDTIDGSLEDDGFD